MAAAAAAVDVVVVVVAVVVIIGLVGCLSRFGRFFFTTDDDPAIRIHHVCILSNVQSINCFSYQNNPFKRHLEEQSLKVRFNSFPLYRCFPHRSQWREPTRWSVCQRAATAGLHQTEDSGVGPQRGPTM